jgi:hypothetical protein
MLVGVAKKPHFTSNLTRPNGHEHLISLLVAASHRALPANAFSSLVAAL